MAFDGFTNETIPWFEGLEAYNSRDYFLADREVFERSVRKPLLDLLTDLSEEFGGEIKLFRPHRDVRFSKDKSPYKTNSSGHLSESNATAAILYVSVSSEGIHTASGYYQMMPDQLTRYRKALSESDQAVDNGHELRKMLEKLRKKGYELSQPEMKVNPRGIPKDSPNSDLVRYKSVTVSSFLEPEKIASKSVVKWVSSVWKDAHPVNSWLDQHVGKSTLPPDENL